MSIDKVGSFFKAGESVGWFVVLLIGSGIAWGVITGRVTASEDDIRELKLQTKAIKQQLQEVKENQASTDTHLTDIDKKIDVLSNEQKTNTRLLLKIDGKLSNHPR